jgi:hypothetical protein
MAFNKYVSGAWQEAETAKRYSNGAWVECETAKRYISGAWQDVWTNKEYFLKDGVLMNGATLHYGGKQGNGYVYATSSEIYEEVSVVKFQLTSDMIGKTLYIKASPNVTAHSESVGNSWLTFYYPNGEYSHSGVWFENRVGDFLTFTIQSNHVTSGKLNYICVDHTMSGCEYRFYDIYVK